MAHSPFISITIWIVSVGSPTTDTEPLSSAEQISVSAEDIKLFASPKVEVKSETNSPERGGKKNAKKEKGVGSFSVERFGDSDKDIEYYTGFQTFTKFEAFYRSINIYVENLKTTDMMYGVANLTQTPSQPESGLSSKDGSAEILVEEAAPVQEEQKRRLSQGRSMSRIDELFMTVIRLKRKIPEKVLGHMFCISQPTVSRIIRAWTMLLSRVLELLPPEKSKSSRKVVSGSGSSIVSSPPAQTDEGTQSQELGIPYSFRQLFYSDLAQSIIASGAATNSRKTSSSTTCPNISRSKRPKKEKVVVSVVETEGVGTSISTPPVISVVTASVKQETLPPDTAATLVHTSSGKSSSDTTVTDGLSSSKQ